MIFLFIGIGDARHFLGTLMDIFNTPPSGKQVAGFRIDTKYLFTLSDLKAPVIARDLIFLLLLDRIAQLDDLLRGPEADELIITLFFTYNAPIIPARAFEILQDTSRFQVTQASHIAVSNG